MSHALTLVAERARRVCRRLTGAKARARRRAMGEFDAALARLGPGDLVLDLGANVGLISERIAATGADLVAFEPDPHAFAQAQSRLARFPNATLVNEAVGATEGDLALFRHRDFDSDPDRRSTSSTLVPGKRQTDETVALTIHQRDLVGWLVELDRDVALMKVDIEGSEVALMERLLDHPVAQRIGLIFVETHETVLPSLAVRTRALRRRGAALSRPRINWDWH